LVILTTPCPSGYLRGRQLRLRARPTLFLLSFRVFKSPTAQKERATVSKFGVFNPGQARPVQVLEGQKMSQDGEFVRVLDKDEIVGVVRLDRGQAIRPMTEEDEKRLQPRPSHTGRMLHGSPWA
jgi:hypothetical protein